MADFKAMGKMVESGIDIYTSLYLKQITNKALLYDTGNSAQYWEKDLKRNRYMYMYNRITLPYTWNYHYIVNQLYPIIK